MKTNLQTFAVPASLAASFLVGCSTPTIHERTDPTRHSTVQVAEGYDTLGRKWEADPQPTAAKPAPAPAPTPAPAPVATAAKPEMLTRHEYVLLNYTGTITDIDYPNREMTLRSTEGRYETFYVDKKVQRFNEAKVGDKVSMDYYLGVNAEVRKPTSEEEQNPLVVVETGARADSNAPPAARGMRQIRAVCTIEKLDRKAQTITVKGPRGKYFTAHVVDPSRFDKVRIGETVLMTFTESTAISLKPAAN